VRADPPTSKQFAPSPLTRLAIRGQAADNGEEPGAEWPIRLERARLLMYDRECVLYHVFGIVDAADELNREQGSTTNVPPHEARERSIIAARGRAEQLAIGA
jgi:hypothetical protein